MSKNTTIWLIIELFCYSLIFYLVPDLINSIKEGSKQNSASIIAQIKLIAETDPNIIHQIEQEARERQEQLRESNRQKYQQQQQEWNDQQQQWRDRQREQQQEYQEMRRQQQEKDREMRRQQQERIRLQRSETILKGSIVAQA